MIYHLWLPVLQAAPDTIFPRDQRLTAPVVLQVSRSGDASPIQIQIGTTDGSQAATNDTKDTAIKTI